MGSAYVNDFDLQQPLLSGLCAGRSTARMTAGDLRHSMCVRTPRQMVPLDNMVTLAETVRAAGHQPLQPVPLGGNRWRCRSRLQFGTGLATMEALAKKNMIQGMSFSWTGLALEEDRGRRQGDIIFGLGCWSFISRFRRNTRASLCPSSSCWLFRWRCWEHWA